jgi:hypothetical protein
VQSWGGGGMGLGRGRRLHACPLVSGRKTGAIASLGGGAFMHRRQKGGRGVNVGRSTEGQGPMGGEPSVGAGGSRLA